MKRKKPDSTKKEPLVYWIQVDLEKCVGCGTCVQDCPMGAVRLKKGKARMDRRCTLCGACIRICPEGALSIGEPPEPTALQCEACPILCRINEGCMGACQRYQNQGSMLVRLTSLHSYDDVKETVGSDPPEVIRRPLITGIGAGTTYPDCKPAPAIVTDRRNDVDVVTVVTEAPLSYSSLMVKIDTDVPIGEEGSAVLVGKRKVGMVETEHYGSKILHVGGVNRMTGENGLLVARTITEIANRDPVQLKIEGAGRLTVQVGQPPIINKQEIPKMRVGCGSATLGLFAAFLKEAADEVIVLDSHITGLMSEHAAGRFEGAKPTGVRLWMRRSTPGRYFGDHGDGWGGTSIRNPLDAIEGIDPNTAWRGMRVLVTETTGTHGSLYRLEDDGRLHEIPLTGAATRALKAISSTCEPSRVSAVYMGGAGGSARAGVTRFPIKLTRAVHAGKASLTVGGAPVFVLPGGGINFMVDVERVKPGAFYWTPTPATICPIEYTMELSEYEKMGGHVEAMKPFHAKEPKKRK